MNEWTAVTIWVCWQTITMATRLIMLYGIPYYPAIAPFTCIEFSFKATEWVRPTFDPVKPSTPSAEMVKRRICKTQQLPKHFNLILGFEACFKQLSRRVAAVYILAFILGAFLNLSAFQNVFCNRQMELRNVLSDCRWPVRGYCYLDNNSSCKHRAL